MLIDGMAVVLRMSGWVGVGDEGNMIADSIGFDSSDHDEVRSTPDFDDERTFDFDDERTDTRYAVHYFLLLDTL